VTKKGRKPKFFYCLNRIGTLSYSAEEAGVGPGPISTGLRWRLPRQGHAQHTRARLESLETLIGSVMTSKTPKPNVGGRPGRAVASAKALAALGVDPATIDPMWILASIAADASAPAAARVAACRVLLGAPKAPERDKMDQASSRAITLLQQGRLH
jgi:hypothetical protein